MSDLSPKCAPKRTSIDHAEFTGSCLLRSVFRYAPPRVICPSCQSVAVGFIDSDPKSAIHPMPSRPTEGRLAIVTDAGRDAMDANGAQRRSALDADGEVVWS